MADGQLAAAEACYRDAVAAASVARLPNFANVANFGSRRARRLGAAPSTIRAGARRI